MLWNKIIRGVKYFPHPNLSIHIIPPLLSVGNTTALFILIFLSSFHDCVRYKGKQGGCDGCLNWHGVGHRFPGLGNQVECYL